MLVHSVMSSVHRLGGLPGGRVPSTIPNVKVFVSRVSSIRHMWPNNCSFRCLMLSTTVTSRPISFLMSSFLLMSCHFMFISRRSSFVNVEYHPKPSEGMCLVVNSLLQLMHVKLRRRSGCFYYSDNGKSVGHKYDTTTKRQLCDISDPKCRSIS